MASTSSVQGAAQVLVASNRGPVSYEVQEDGSLRPKRGGGGLVSGLSAIGPEAGALWVCSALSDGDREAVRQGGGGGGGRLLAPPPGGRAGPDNGNADPGPLFVHP